jgi:S1-C subfamily serine protease
VVAVGGAALGVRAFFAQSEPPAAEIALISGAPATQIAPAPASALLMPLAGGDSTPAATTTSPALVVQPHAMPAASETAAGTAPLEELVARAIPAVAVIQAGNARGTGFFVKHDTVLTNVHVVDGQASVELQVGASKYTARVVTTSTATDLAVLRVVNASPSQATLRLGSAQGARVGQEVVAIGSALGVLSNTVTRGIVSAVRQAGEVTLIQTDAAINPGNSGGPLIDRHGQVIGVNTMKALARAESIGFAVAIDHATALLNGQTVSSTGSSPVSGLETMLRQGGVSETEQARNEGQDAYEHALTAAAQRAVQLNNHWDRYATACVSSSVNAGDRRWLAALERSGVRLANNTAIDCREWLSTVSSNARALDQDIRDANERGRRAGVFPGVMRDIRRQHRLDAPQWDR